MRAFYCSGRQAESLEAYQERDALSSTSSESSRAGGCRTYRRGFFGRTRPSVPALRVRAPGPAMPMARS